MKDAVRHRLHVRGVVQGVGFRPFVFGLAQRLGVAGFVRNDPSGVVMEAEADPSVLDSFRRALLSQAPPLAVVETIEVEAVPATGETGFEIAASATAGPATAALSPDIATCEDCLQEIADPSQRRYGYPFTNCTNCGPRFTITTSVPYDRATTTMASFAMCADCKSEYEDPTDRRFHAQPIACPACGPRLQVVDGSLQALPGDPIELAATLLEDGRIVAIKGLGGYHLACDAQRDDVVRRLRARKHREEKPFALMSPDLEWAERHCHVGDAERAALSAQECPIVLLARQNAAAVAPAVAPGNRYLGVVLPYTPLHHLLMQRVGRPIVLTSGNISDEPIAFHDEDAFQRLADIVDAFVVHDRDIHIRCDDSVLRVSDGRIYPLRRARGFTPRPITVDPPFVRPTLAAGPELKHTFCLGIGDRAIPSQHIGDLENWEAMSAFVKGIEHFTRVFDVHPEVIAHDLHPEYLSTKWAKSIEGVTTIGVQHHHAHIASCLADRHHAAPVIGLALDGTGYGDDDTIWGCEVMVCDLAGYERLFHLRYVPLPGGSAAIREPWRIAAVYLHEAFGEEASELALDVVRATRERWRPVLALARSRLNSPLASSAGRLFDAVAALCSGRERVSYEGQAAAELEQLADPAVTRSYPLSLRGRALDGVELVRAAAEDLVAGAPPSEVAAAFHNALVDALVACCKRARGDTGIGTVALSGGTFQNVFLLERLVAGLGREGFEVLVHRRVPPNDGGIALGQAVAANARVRAA